MQIINNQPQHDSPKNDQNSSSSPPNNSKKHQQNNQSQQRRTAAERRASHRRRSTAQANELVQLAQLRKGIEKSRTSQDSPNIEKIAEEHSTKEENSEKTMIIPNQQMDNSTKTTKNILTTTDSDEFPPEPTITAPGSEEEEFVNNENICINLLEEEQVATLMLFEPSPTSSTTSPPIRITPKTTTNKNIPDIPPSTHPFKQKYYHQRSISDHLLNYSSSKNIQKQQLKNQEKPFGEDNNPLPPPKYIYSSQLDSESPLNLQNNKYNNINTKFSMAAATTKKKAPILAQIRRLKREEEFNDQMGSNDYNTEPEEEEDNEDKYYESSAIEDDDIEFANRLSRPQQRLNRVCSGDGELVKLRNVHNNDDDFSPPPPSFTTTPTSLSSFSALKAATALAGVNLSLTRGLENSSIPTSNSSTPSNTKTKNGNKKSASFSSTPSSSSGIANLFSLGNRFSTNRQNSDSSLLRRNSQKVKEQQQQNLLCSRRSFKWKNLWGRKNSGTSIDDSNIVVGSNVSKGGSNVSTPTGSLFSTKRASSQLLDTLIEDTETFSISGGSKEEELKQKRRLKRHSALLLVEGNDKEGKGVEDEGKERSFNQNANSALTPVRFRASNQTINSSSRGEKSERREEEKTECQEILSSSILQQRPFSIIGTGQDSEPSLISSSKVHNMLSVEEEDSSEQQLLPNEQLARYRIEEDLLERFDEFLFKCRRKGLRTLRNVNEDSFGVDEEEEGDNGREEEVEMRKIIKQSSNNRGRDGKLDKEEDNTSLQKSATSSTLLKKPNHKQVERTAPPLPPRLSRATRRSTNCSPILYISTCQTLDRRQNNKKLALHRAVSSRANNLTTNLTTSTSPFSYTSTLTLPRKRPPPRGVSTQQRRRGNITSAATRRKSIVQLAVEDSVELAAIVAAVEEHEKEDLKGEGGGDGEGHEAVKEVESAQKEVEARQVDEEKKQKPKETKQQTQQQQAMFRVKSSKHLTTSTNHHSTKCAILRHLLGATTNNNNNRVCGGGKVAPKNNGTLITSSNNNLGNATISGGSCVAEMAMDGAANRTISKDNKKRETKTNSMILGTIWSIRPRRKKESNAQRSLVNLWASQSPTENISANIAADMAVANKSCPNGNGDFMNNFADQQQLLQQQNLSQHQSSLLNQSPSSTTPNVGSSSPFCSPTSTTTDGIFNHNNGPSTASSNFFPRAQLQHSRWADLELWTEQETSWTAKYCVGSDNEFSSLSAKEMKRQNIIYELVLTERHHCQVLVLLQQLYYEGLAHNRILTPKQLQLLIPDVEALLDFHLSFLRSLIERCSQSPIVDEISDILLTEFGSGNFRNNAINSYTAFCLGREDSAKQYSTLIAQNIHFRKFMEYYEGQHKDRSLKDCMLLVAQRLTKYPVLVEQIAKQESQPSKQLLAQKAHSIVREFAMQVDQQLMQHELNKKWTALKKALDKSAAIAKLIHPKDGIDFSFDDLVWPVENDSTITLTNLTKTIGRRQILLITRAFWRETMNGPELELRLLLCDDIIVFLRPKGGGGGSSSSTVNVGSNSNAANTKLPPLQFFRHISHSGVLPLHSILVRGENVRRKSLLLIVTAKQRPDLFEFAFPTSVELENFALAIKKAKVEAPNFVRLADGKCFEFADKPIGDGMGKPIINSDDFKTQMENWKLELDQLFGEGDLRFFRF
ncbi:unnamed protein product [Meloidogyne enterolobii]|uniref:Uncharacterized protein n=1 Tax=Meloidogyne enterolobii TaxID=390850 RepID=A0ACB0Z5V1_MELEN